MEKYKSPEVLPTPFESELLGILAEECSEVIQRAIKIQRFGLLEQQPGQPLTNRERFSEEIGQLFYMIEIADRFGLIDQLQCQVGLTNKLDALKKYMQNEPPGGWESYQE
jgi:hypothetical protein